MIKSTITRSLFLLLVAILLMSGCVIEPWPEPARKTVPHEQRWGIYALDLSFEDVELIYSSPRKISTLRLNSAGDRLVFSQKIDGDKDIHEEICTLRVDGTDHRRLTDNELWDLCPAWSPDGTQIAFLSGRDGTLDIFMMNASGGNVRKIYDSGGHDAASHYTPPLEASNTHSCLCSVLIRQRFGETHGLGIVVEG